MGRNDVSTTRQFNPSVCKGSKPTMGNKVWNVVSGALMLTIGLSARDGIDNGSSLHVLRDISVLLFSSKFLSNHQHYNWINQ